MSDLLSVVASITGLVKASAKITSIANQLYNSSKDAPASICRVKDEMGQQSLILRQVQRLMEYEMKGLNRNRLSMLPLEELTTILNGCVSAYSALDQKLRKVADFFDEADPKTPKTVPQTMSVKWELWQELSEMADMIVKIEQHKSSLLTMLNIIQRYLGPYNLIYPLQILWSSPDIQFSTNKPNVLKWNYTSRYRESSQFGWTCKTHFRIWPKDQNHWIIREGETDLRSHSNEEWISTGKITRFRGRHRGDGWWGPYSTFLCCWR